MIVNDQKCATFVATSVVTILLTLGFVGGSARAASITGPEDTPPIVATLVRDGQSATYETRARNVVEFLEQSGVQVSPGDFVSPALDRAVVDGMRVVYRSAFNFSIQVDGKRVAAFGAPATVADAIAAQNIKLGKYDRTEPARDARVKSGMLVRIVRINSWTSHVLETIAAGVSHRFDPSLAAGVTRTVDAGEAGKRELTVRYTKRENERAKRIVLASSVVTEPRPKILVHGIGEFTAIFAGVRDAVAFTGTRIRMVATAYVPYCAGCSGITKLGLRAGHGVVAVDPNVIPLGSRLYVPGYGKAVAGDTGGAIRGNRIDLGFNDLGEALRFGRRPITVYVLR